MYNYYHNTANSLSLLDKLPAFVTKDIDSNFYKLINPYGVFAERFYQDCIDTGLIVNPMFMDYGLPNSIYLAMDIPYSYTPHTTQATLVKARSLDEFSTGYPTVISDSFTSSTFVNHNAGGGADEMVVDAHYVSPIYYNNSDGVLQKLDSGFVLLHEGIYTSENLITIYDDNWNFITSLNLNEVHQIGSDLIDDEWIEGITGTCEGTDVDPNLNSTDCGSAGGTYVIDKYYLNNRYLVKDSLRVINPLASDANGSALVIDPAGYSIGFDSEGAYLDFNESIQDTAGNTYSIHNISLIVEYSYMPSLNISAMTYLSSYHSVAAMQKSSAQPLSFQYISNINYELNGGAAITGGYESTTQYEWTDTLVKKNVSIRADESSIAGTVFSSKLQVHGHEAREGTTVTERSTFTLQYDEQFSFSSGDEFKSTASTLNFLNIRSVKFTIDSTNAPSTDFNGNDIVISSSDFSLSRSGDTFIIRREANSNYLSNVAVDGTETYTDIDTVVNLQFETDIVRETSQSVNKYYTKYTETVEVVTPGATETFWLSYPNASVLTATDPSEAAVSVASENNLEKSIQLDTSGLSAGDLIVVEYNAYTLHYTKDDKKWFESIINYAIDISSTFPGCTFIKREVDSVTKNVKGCSSVAWFNREIHLEENSFSKALICVDGSDNTLYLYDTSNNLLDSKLIIGAGNKITITNSDSSTSDFYSTTTSGREARSIRYFENTIMILFAEPNDGGDSNKISNHGAQLYDIKTFNIDTMEELLSQSYDLGSDFKINAFTLDKEHNILLIDSGGKVFKTNFEYHYYYGTDNGEMGDFFIFFFRNLYSDLEFQDDTGATQLEYSNGDFKYEERILNYSTDELGRIIGSDKWWGESGTEYLDRLKNITKADGNVTKQLALAGISATVNAESYPCYNVTQFSLGYPLKEGEAANTIVTLNGNYDYHNGAGNTGTLLTHNNHFTLDEPSKGNSIITITSTSGVAVDSDGKINVEVIYKSTLLDSSNNNIIITENFVYENHTQPQDFDNRITIDRLNDSVFIDTNHIVRDGVESTGIYNSSLINYFKMGSSNFKFKWDEFEWDQYEWADGASIKNGLPTYFDGITSIGYTGIDPLLQKFDNGTSGNALKYLGKTEKGIPKISMGKFFYLDAEYNIYNDPHELLLDPASYPVAGTWHDSEWTPLVYFTDESGNGTVDTPNYIQPGCGAPVVVNDEVSAIAMSIAPGDTGLNELNVSHELLSAVGAGATVSLATAEEDFATQTDGSFVYEVYMVEDIATHKVKYLHQGTDYTIDIPGQSFTSLLPATEDIMLVFNSSTYLNSYYLVANKPESSNLRINRLSSFNYAGTSNKKTLMTDSSRHYHHEDLTGLNNPYTDSTISEITSNSTASLTTDDDFQLRDSVATGSRPWITDSWEDNSTDIKIKNIGSSGIYTFLCDKSYENFATITPGEGPQLNYKENNIGNSLLVVGRTNLEVETVEIQSSKMIIKAVDSVFLFVTLKDSEKGRVPSKWVKASTQTANTSISPLTPEVTKEDGMAILKLDIEVTVGTAGSYIQVDIESNSDDETWTNSINLMLSETVS